MDPDAPVDRVQPMSAYVGDALAQSRLTLVLMAGFGVVALIMAAVGIYGVISYSVSQRTKEIGIRMALGQEAWQIRNLVVGQGLRLVGMSLASASRSPTSWRRPSRDCCTASTRGTR